MPAFLLSLATGIGIPPRFAKYAVIAAGIVLLGLAILAAVKIHDHRVIAAHQAAQDAANAKADRKADDNAAVQRRTDDARLTNESTQLTETQHGATSDLDRRLAFQRCLRMQQAARRDSKQSPACN